MMKRFSRLPEPAGKRASWRDHALAACSGLALSAAFPDIGLWPLAWIGLVPLLAAMRDKTVLAATKLGVVSGFFFFTPTLYWVSNTMIVYAGIPVPVAAAINCLMTLTLALYIGVFAYFFGWISRGFSDGAALAAAPFVWVAIEFFRSNLFFLSFPWARIADSQYEVLPIIQIADVAGEDGVGFMIVLFNAALVKILSWAIGKKAGNAEKFPAAWAVVTGALLIATLGYGQWRLAAMKQNEDGAVRVALIQGNIDQARKWDPTYIEPQTDIYVTRTMTAAAGGGGLVVWPETAAPFYFGQDPGRDQRIFNLSRLAKAPIIFGAPAYKKEGGAFISYNRSWVVRPDGLAEKYDKVHLVPFGEYVPMRQILFFIEKIVTAIGEIEPGERVNLLHTKDHAFGAQICFEIIFPKYSRQITRMGAAAIVNITNDSWYGKTPASRQSLAMGVFRAVENRIPVLRAAQSGISAIVTSAGEITGETRLFEETTLMGDFTPRRGGSLTVYTVMGDTFPLMCAGVSIIFLAAARRGAGRRRAG